MEVIKKKISISDLLSGDVHFKVQLTQKLDDLGMSTDIPYDTYTLSMSVDKLLFGHYTSSDLTEFYKENGTIKYITDSKLQALKSYDINEPYKKDLDMNTETYLNYKGSQVNGVDKVTNVNGSEITYVMGTKKDINIGTSGQTTGILYIDNPVNGLEPNNANINEFMATNAQYESEGWNISNSSLDPNIREEYLFGIISQPEVESDVFIDRGVVSILDSHLRLSEIESLDHLERYGNGYYNINRD